MVRAIIAIVVGAVLVVAGVALIHIPSALILAGVGIGVTGFLFVDIEPGKPKR